MKKLSCIALLGAALLAGCNPVPEADSEACEHLQSGSAAAAAVTASATGTDAPAVSDDHKRYDISLVDVSGGKGGSVTFAAAEASDYIFFTSASVPLAIKDSSGQAVEIEESTSSSPGCAEVKGRSVVGLEVGTYTITFGPTTESSVSLVIEPSAHAD